MTPEANGTAAPVVFLGMPGYGELTAGAARGFWRSTRRPESEVVYQYREGSLLAANFNALWCAALNLAAAGHAPRYFAMQHADIEPEDWWLDTLIAELEAHDLDILGVAAPIKDGHGLTSLALDRPDGDPWRPLCRLTLAEVHRLPPTFTSADVGHPLLLNTGLWVCRFAEAWARKVRFTINDRIVLTPEGRYHAEVEPEDWYFSRLGHELGLKIGATRKVRLSHRGPAEFRNDRVLGAPFDAAYVESSPLPEAERDGFRFPFDVEGWLTRDEGRALYDLAKGQRVLEIGSYCGRSTICLAQSAEMVRADDTWDGRGTPDPRDTLPDFLSNLIRYGLRSKVSFTSPRPIGFYDQFPGHFAGTFEWRFDLIFIDGAHDRESVQSDLEYARGALARGGLLVFHDYRLEPAVTEAVDALIDEGGKLLSIVDSLAVVRPPADVPALSLVSSHQEI